MRDHTSFKDKKLIEPNQAGVNSAFFETRLLHADGKQRGALHRVAGRDNETGLMRRTAGQRL
jgi:hypothetical protein